MERLIEVQKSCVNARTDISAAFHRGGFYESEPSSSRTLNKIAAVLCQLSYEDPYFSSKPIFWLLFFLIREGNETWNKDNVNCRNTRYDRHSFNRILSSCKLTQINLRGFNAIPPLFWLWSWIPMQSLREHETSREINVCRGRCGWTLCLMFLLGNCNCNYCVLLLLFRKIYISKQLIVRTFK